MIPYLVPLHYLQIQSTSVFFQCATLFPTSVLRNGTGDRAMCRLCLLNPVALAPNGNGTRDNASVPETMQGSAIVPETVQGFSVRALPYNACRLLA